MRYLHFSELYNGILTTPEVFSISYTASFAGLFHNSILLIFVFSYPTLLLFVWEFRNWIFLEVIFVHHNRQEYLQNSVAITESRGTAWSTKFSDFLLTYNSEALSWVILKKRKRNGRYTCICMYN